MKTKRLIALLSAFLLYSVMAQEIVVATWDFTKGVPSGEYGGELRQCGRVGEGGHFNEVQGDKPGGFATK